jgi:hypothetical protein
MRVLTLTVEVSDDDARLVLPVLERVIDEDGTLGMRLKDVDNAPEHELAPQVYATVLSVGVE